MKKKLKVCFFFLSILHSFHLNAMRKGTRALGPEEIMELLDDDHPRHTSRNKDYDKIIQELRTIESLQESIKAEQEKLGKATEEQEKENIKLTIKKLERARNALQCPEIKSFSEALQQGISRGLIGRGYSEDDNIFYVLTQAVTEKASGSLGKVVTKRSISMWEYLFDKIESGVSYCSQFLGFSPTISLDDIIRWQDTSSELSTIFKELRKNIDTTESRTTSMQFRSILSDDFDEEQEKTTKETTTIADLEWITLRESALIFLIEDLLYKLEIKQDEITQKGPLYASARQLITSVQGLVDQLKTINTLQDLIQPKKTHMITTYFSLLDSGLKNLERIIDPENAGRRSSRKKQSNFTGNGYMNDF